MCNASQYLSLIGGLLLAVAITACADRKTANTASINSANRNATPAANVTMKDNAFLRLSFKENTPASPMVIGETNLPNDTELLVSVEGETTHFRGQDKAKVTGGVFKAGPFGPSGGLKPGLYTANVTMAIPPLQPASVRAVIGENGEYLRGPLVSKSDLGVSVIATESLKVTSAGIAVSKIDASEVQKAKAQAREVLQALRALEQEGRSMESLRNTDNVGRVKQCGDLMRQRQQAAKDLLSRAERLPTAYGFLLSVAARELMNCVTCQKSAIEACNLAKKSISEAENAIKGK